MCGMHANWRGDRTRSIECMCRYQTMNVYPLGIGMRHALQSVSVTAHTPCQPVRRAKNKGCNKCCIGDCIHIYNVCNYIAIAGSGIRCRDSNIIIYNSFYKNDFCLPSQVKLNIIIHLHVFIREIFRLTYSSIETGVLEGRRAYGRVADRGPGIAAFSHYDLQESIEKERTILLGCGQLF